MSEQERNSRYANFRNAFNRCAINRNPSPGVRPSRPFPGRLRDDESLASIRDGHGTDTLYGETVILAGEITVITLGIVKAPATDANFHINLYDGMNAIDSFTSDTLLIPVRFLLMKNYHPIFELYGSRGFGTGYNVDCQGGEEIQMMIDNTDPRSTIDGETFAMQVFLFSVPEYTIEVARKGNPVP